MNAKQILYSIKKVHKAKMRMLFRLYMFIAVCFLAETIAFASVNPEKENIEIATGSGVTMAVTMAAIGNFDEVSDRETASNQISARVYLVEISQLNISNPWAYNSATFTVTSLSMKPGEYMHYFTAIDDTLDDLSAGEKGEISFENTNTFSFIMGGNKTKLRQFMEEKAGGRFLVIYEEVLSDSKIILGSPKKPMILKKFERKNGKEGKYVTFTFENKSFDQPKNFTGNIVTEDPATLIVDSTILAISSKDRYNTAANTAPTTLATVSGLAEADWGRVIDIIGVGGDDPTKIAESSVFVLINGQEWTGNAGSRISFKILDSNTLVEVEGSRSQTA